MTKAILLSGGMDSIALCYWKKPKFAITIDYGQVPAKAEISAARSVSKVLQIEHHVIKVDCSSLGSGDLLNKSSLSMSSTTEWWPYRNQLIITLAVMKAITLGINELMIGTVRTDKIHKDGHLTFVDNISRLISYQEGGIIVTAPAITLSTNNLVKKSGIPLSLLLWAHSCHKSNIPCMDCNGCYKYLYNIQKLGLDNG